MNTVSTVYVKQDVMSRTMKKMVEDGLPKRVVVSFTKEDGTVRRLNGLLNLKGQPTGRPATYNPSEKNVAIVFDVELAQVNEPEECWRAVRMDRIHSLEFGTSSGRVRCIDENKSKNALV